MYPLDLLMPAPCPSPLASFLPQLPSPTLALMGSSAHLDATRLPHLISDFPSAYSVFPPSVPWPFPPSARASAPLDYPELGRVSLPLPLSVAP